MGSTTVLKDESGVSWLILHSQDDPLYTRVLHPCLQKDFVGSSLILPDELPRTLTCKEPDWTRARQLWDEEGDSVRFQEEVVIQQLREVVLAHELDTERPGSTEGEAMSA